MSVSTHDAAATRTSIPKTVVQKVASESPSHGDVPGTAAYLTHMADAVPDLIVQVPENGEKPTSKLASRSKSNEVPIPTTVVTKVDSKPSHGEVSGTDAFDIRKADADPDEIDTKGDVSSKLFSSC